MSGEVGGKPREYEVMVAKNGSRERVSRRRVWLTVGKDITKLKYETEGKLVPGVWIIFCRQRGGHEKF